MSTLNRILPLELIDKAIGSQIWILMRGSKEIVGTLRGFDDYVRTTIKCVWFVHSFVKFVRHNPFAAQTQFSVPFCYVVCYLI